MAHIILPQRWTRQPQMAMRVNRSHPLARDLIEFGYVLGGHNPISAMPGLVDKPSLAGTTDSVATPHGLGINTNGTGNYIDLGRNLSASSVVATGIVRTTLPDPLVASIAFTTASQSGANYVGHFLQLSAAGAIQGYYGNGGGTATANYKRAASPTGLVVPGPNTIAFVCRAATDWSLYKDGVSTGTPSYVGNATSHAAGTANGTINFRSAVALYGSQSASSWAFFNRALTDAEILELYVAPFQILQPIRRRVFVAVSGGGAQTLTPSLFTSSNTFYAPTVSGTYTLSPGLYTDADTFYSPTVSTSYSITPGLYTDPDTFYSPAVSATYTLTPGLYDDVDTFYTHVVSLGGSQTLVPGLYVDSDTFYSPTVSSTYTLTPALYADPDTFYSATVSATYTLTSALYADADSFYSATVAATYSLAPALYSDTDTFYSPTVGLGVGLHVLLPSLYTDPDIFYTPVVGRAYGTGQITRYVTIDFDGTRRVDIRRDLLDHVAHKDHLNYTKVSHTDEIRYSTQNDKILYSK